MNFAVTTIHVYALQYLIQSSPFLIPTASRLTIEMSHEALPIDRRAFAEALESLPLDALHGKAAEISNSITHLKSSNDQMMPFADDGDQDCKDAMFENLMVIGRMNERIGMLRAEVERRGMRWADAEVEDANANKDHDMIDTHGQLVNGHANGDVRSTVSAPSGRLTDEELRTRLAQQLDEGDEDGDEGVHL